MLDAIVNNRNHILSCVAVLEGEQKLLQQSAKEIKEKIEQLNSLK